MRKKAQMRRTSGIHAMTLQMYPHPEKSVMTLQMFPLPEEPATTLQICHLQGNTLGNQVKGKAQVCNVFWVTYFGFHLKHPITQLSVIVIWLSCKETAHFVKWKTGSLSSSGAKKTQKRHDSDSDQSPPRKKTLEKGASDSDQSPPRMRPRKSRGSDSDQSPPRRRPRRGKESDEDLSPPRRPGQNHVSIWN